MNYYQRKSPLKDTVYVTTQYDLLHITRMITHVTLMHDGLLTMVVEGGEIQKFETN